MAQLSVEPQPGDHNRRDHTRVRRTENPPVSTTVADPIPDETARIEHVLRELTKRRHIDERTREHSSDRSLGLDESL